MENIMTIDEKLLEILVCPKCKQPVVLSAQGDALDCAVCQLHYPVEDGIPVMMIDEAKPYAC
jgi:uncharacterized protein YbaR (Trm112 family)